jgi:hypothetical protein
MINPGDRLLLENENITVWAICPVCGWAIDAETILYARVDLECFDCGKACLSEFILVAADKKLISNERKA